MEQIFKEVDMEAYMDKMYNIYPEVIETYADDYKDEPLRMKLVPAPTEWILLKIFQNMKMLKEEWQTTAIMLKILCHISKTGEWKQLSMFLEDAQEMKSMKWEIENGDLHRHLVLAARWAEYAHRIYERPYMNKNEGIRTGFELMDYVWAIEGVKKTETFGEEKEQDSNQPFPIRLVEYAEQYVIGQRKALEQIALVINRYMNSDTNKDNLTLIKASTGSGKNHIFDVIEAYFEKTMPVLVYDFSQLTPSGYKGINQEDVFDAFARKCREKDLPKNKGIIVLNEADKILQPDIHESEFHTQVQQQWLSVLEGRSVIKGINTADILFVLVGAFENFEKDKKSKTKHQLGFMKSEKETNQYLETSNLRKELIEYGAERELMGRVSKIIQMRKLDKEDMKQVLMHPKIGAIERVKKEMEALGKHVEFTEEAIDKIAEVAVLEDLGARSAINMITELVDAYQYEMLENKYFKMTIHAGVIENQERPWFEGGKENETSFRYAQYL